VSPATEPLATLARIQEASFTRASEATRRSFPAARRMDGATLQRFLTDTRYGVLATVRPDGRPHAAPVGYALVGVTFVFASLGDALRVHNLRAEPHASLVVSKGEDATHAAVIAEGTARLLAPMDAPLEMRAPFRDPDGNLPEWAGVLIALTPERLLSYAAPGFGA
jgi:hypothetical protein